MATLDFTTLFHDRGAARGVADLASKFEKAAGSATSLESATKRLAMAESKAADAAGQMRVAEARLDAVRNNAKATSVQRLQAEENLARAQRRLVTSQNDVKVSSDKVAAAQKHVKVQLQQSGEQATKTDSRMRKAVGGLHAFGSAGVSATGHLVGGFKAVGIGAAGAAVGIAAAATAPIMFGLKTAAAMENAEIAFTTMLGSARKARVFLGQLQQFAAKTPFEFPELQTAASSLISVGINAKKVIPIMTTLGNVTSGMGTGSEGVKRATVALQQMQSAGRITAEDLNQLRDAGIPLKVLFKAMGEELGVSSAKLFEMSRNGKLGKEELEALMTVLQSGKGFERFNGLMDKQSRSLNGMLSTLKDTFGQGMANALKSALPFLKDGIGALTTEMGKVFKVIEDHQDDIKEVFRSIKRAMKQINTDDVVTGITNVIEALPGIVTQLDAVITKWGQFTHAVDNFEKKSFGEGDKVGGPIGQIVKDFGAGGTIEVALVHFRWAAHKFVKKGWADAKASFIKDNGEIISGVKNFAGKVAGWFSRLGGRLKNSTTDMLASIKSSWKARTGEIADKVSGWKDRLVTIGKKLSSDLRGRMSDMLTSIKDRFRGGTSAIADRVSGWKDRLVTIGKRLSSSLRGVISDMLSRIKDRFHSGVDAIGRAWDNLKAKARGPVKFVIQSVLNGGLIRAFNIIAGALHVHKLDPVHVPKGWASGTSKVLPGYTPGRDVHRFYSATGGVMDLSGGEGIARPELVRAVGKRRWDAANKAASNGRVDEGLHYLGGYAQGTSGIGAAKAYARSIGLGSGSTYPGHGELGSQYSWDFMTGNRSKGEQLANWAWANRKAIHLWYEIYYRRIRSMTRPGAGWRPYRRSNPHTDHVHLSFYRSAFGGLVGALSRGGAALIDYVKRFGSKIAGPMKRLAGLGNHPWAKMLQAAGGKLKDAMLDKVKSAMKSLAANVVGGGFTAAAGGSNRAIGRRMMLQRWGANQWPPLNSLWTKESGWNTHALNRSSGAYGIPQSLPGSKMASAGSDWRNNPATQIKWGLGYIASRYGSPSAAWRHSQRTNWYDRGGMLPSGGVAMNASGLPERVLSPAMTKSFDRLVQVLGRDRGAAVGTTIIINAPNYVGSQDDLRRTLVDMNRRGQLEVIKRR